MPKALFKKFDLKLALVAAFLTATAASVQSAAGPATANSQIQGEVMMLTSELIVVKSADGTSTLFPIEEGTAVDSAIKTGDHVVVSLNQDRRIISIKPRDKPPDR